MLLPATLLLKLHRLPLLLINLLDQLLFLPLPQLQTPTNQAAATKENAEKDQKPEEVDFSKSPSRTLRLKLFLTRST
jgi:hypothetical protein